MPSRLHACELRPQGRAILISLLLTASAFGMAGLATGRAASISGTVSQVLDGDTFQLEDNRQVRCLGVDAPEKGDAWAEQATQALNQLIGGKSVRLETGRPEKDRDGRLLAYVFLGKTLVNAELLRQGWAHVRRPVLPRYRQPFLDAQDEARTAGRGIWSKAGKARLAVVQVQSRPPRGEPSALNAEFIVLENQGDQPLELTGWTVSDEANRRYLFPQFILGPKARVTLHTGLGKNTETDLYWGSRSAVWNNDGDTVFVRDAAGHLMLVHFY